MRCSEEKIYRKEYWRHSSRDNGKKTRVKGSCIRRTRAPAYKNRNRASWSSKVKARKQKSHNISRQIFGTPKCKTNEIVREGYVLPTNKSKNVIVPPTCIKDRGDLGKGSNIIGPLHKGTLSSFGYSQVANKTLTERHQALRKAVKHLGWLPVFRKLNAVYVLNKRTNKLLSDIFWKDRNWVKNMHNNEFHE